jgi:hypothetical protein
MTILYFIATLLFFAVFVISFGGDASVKEMMFWGVLLLGELMMLCTTLILNKIKNNNNS